MRLLQWAPILLAAAAAYAADAEPPTELVIETTYKPEECKISAQKGDQIQVHYVRIYLLLYSSDSQALLLSIDGFIV